MCAVYRSGGTSMRPSQYHYIKRMWTRNMYKRKGKGCLGSIIDMLVKFFLFIFLAGLILSFGIIVFAIIFCLYAGIGVIYLFFKLLQWIFKKIQDSRKHTDTLKHKHNIEIKNEIMDFDTLYVTKTLEKINSLAFTINTTKERDIFEQSLRVIKEELMSLQRFEGKVNFVNSTPTNDLNRILENEHLTRKNFEERITGCSESSGSPVQEIKEQKTKKTNSFDLERFMIACNAQMAHDDEMEQYKDYD